MISDFDLIVALVEPLADAEAWFSISASPVDASHNRKTIAQRAFACRSTARRAQTREQLLEYWNAVLRPGQLSNVDDSGALTRKLAVWLALYFNGTSEPAIWQEIMEDLDRDVGLPSIAYTMKRYGDVYRIERRRFQERAKFDGENGSDGNSGTADVHTANRQAEAEERALAAGLEPLLGIVTIADHSIVTHPEDHLRLESTIATPSNGRPAAAIDALAEWTAALTGARSGGNRDALSIPAILRSVASKKVSHKTAPYEPLLACVTEYLSRLYCAFQVFRYVRDGLPFWLLLVPDPTAKPEDVQLMADAAEQNARVHLGDTFRQHVILLKHRMEVCVLGTHIGVVRDTRLQLDSPTGIALDSRQLRSKRAELDAICDSVTPGRARDEDGNLLWSRVLFPAAPPVKLPPAKRSGGHVVPNPPR